MKGDRMTDSRRRTVARTSASRAPRRKAAALTVDKALMVLFIGGMAANDHVAPEEAERAHHLVWFTRRFRRRSGDVVGRLIDDARSLLEGSDPAATITRAAQAIPAKLRPSAFALLVDLVLADGTLDRREGQFLRRVASDLKIDPERVRDVIEIIRLKNLL